MTWERTRPVGKTYQRVTGLRSLVYHRGGQNYYVERLNTLCGCKWPSPPSQHNPFFQRNDLLRPNPVRLPSHFFFWGEMFRLSSRFQLASLIPHPTTVCICVYLYLYFYLYLYLHLYLTVPPSLQSGSSIPVSKVSHQAGNSAAAQRTFLLAAHGGSRV